MKKYYKCFYVFLFILLVGYSTQVLAVAAPTVTLKAGSTSLNATGLATDLTWTVKDATSCTSTGPWGSFMSQPVNGYLQNTGGLSLASNVFSITCTGPGGSSTATETVKIFQNGNSPVINSFTATPGTRGTTGGFPWQDVTLTWSASSAAQCSGSVVSGQTDNTWLTELPLSGTKTVRIDSNATFQLKCIASLQSFVTPYASEVRSVTLDTSSYTGPVVNFTPVSSTIAAGQSVNFVWSSPDAGSCTGAGDASFGLYVSSVNGSKTITFPNAGVYTLRLNCYLPTGASFSTQKTATVTVNSFSSSSTSTLGSGPGVANPIAVVTNCMCVAPTQTLSYGDRNNDVLNLQNFLVTQNLLGQESTSGYFGPLTLAAVQKFQVNNGIASPGVTGYGVVGPATRAKIASMLGSSGSTGGVGAAAAAVAGNTGGGTVNVTATSLGSGSYSISWSAPGATYCTSNDFYIPTDTPSASGTATVYGISSATTISVSCFKATGPIQGSVAISGSGSVATNPTGPFTPANPVNPPTNPPANPTNPTNPIYVPPARPGVPNVYTYKFRIGDRVTVVRSPVDTKDFYSTAGVVLGSHAVGDKGTVVAGPQVASSSKWWQVDYDSGVDGWNTQDFLILDGTANAGNASGYLILSVANSDDPARMAMAVGDVSAIMVSSYTASGQIEIPSNNPNRFISSNSAVASIDNVGTVTAKSLGSATMTVTMNGKSATMQVTVGPSNAITNPGAPNLSNVKFALGDRVFVVGNNVNTRAAASTGAVLGVHNTSDLGVVLAGPTTVGGFVWWQINYDTGADGWTAEQYLQVDAGNTPIPPNPTNPPAPTNPPVGGSPIAKFNMGDNAQIVGTNVNTRASASTGAVLGMHSSPDKGSIVGGPTDVSGTTWWQVNFESGVDGWVAEQFLELVQATPSSPKYPISSIKLYGQTIGNGIPSGSPNFTAEPNSSLIFPNIEFPVVVDPGSQGNSIPIEMTIGAFTNVSSYSTCTLTPVLPSTGSAITFSNPRQVTGVAGAYQGIGYVFTGSLSAAGGKTPRDLFRWTTKCTYSGGDLDFSNISIILVRPITLAPYCMVGDSFGPITDQTYAFSVPQNPQRTVSYGDITLPSSSTNYDFEILSYLKIYGSGGFSSILPGTIEQYGSMSCGTNCIQYPSALWRPDILAGGANLDGFAPYALNDDAYKKYVVSGSTVSIKLPGGKIVQGASGADDPVQDDSMNSFTEFWPKSPWGAVSGIKMAGFTLAPLWGANNYSDVTGTVRTLGEPVINLPMTQAELDAGYSFIQTCEAKYGKAGCGGAAGWLYDPRLNAIATVGAGSKPSLQAVNSSLSGSSTFKNPVFGTPYPDYVIGSCRD